MNFGTLGGIELFFMLVVWALPLALLVWFIRTVARIASSLRDIADRLGSLERAVRDTERTAGTSAR